MSASHEITFEVSSSHALTANTASFAGNLFGTPSIVVNHITASGDISASGDLTVNNINVASDIIVADELKLRAGGSVSPGFAILDSVNLGFLQNQLIIGGDGSIVEIEIGRSTGSNRKIEIYGQITASGDISASGNLEGGGLKIDGAEIFAGPNILKLQSGSDATDSAAVLRTSNERLLINSAGAFDTIEALNAGLIATNITASGAISASGVINGQNLFGGVFGRIYPDSAQTSNNQFFTANANGINSNSSFTVTGNVTASGNISASGEIETNKFVSNGVDVAQFAAGAVQLGGGILQPTALSGTGITLGITGQNQPVTVISALTASIISASGHLAVNDVHANNFRLMTPADAAGSFPMIKTRSA